MPRCHITGTQALLSAAAAAFKQQGQGLQGKQAHSTYQRGIATALSRLRVMHVLEDNSAAGEGQQGAWGTDACIGWGQ